MKIGALIGTMILLSLWSCATTAVTAATTPVITLSAADMPMDKVMAEVGKQSGSQIVCDTDVKGAVNGNFSSMELEKFLDTITKLHKLKWQKVYLQSKAEQKPTLAQLKARADAVSALTGGAFVIQDPVTGKQKVFVEQDSAKPSVDPDKLGLKPVYLVTSTNAKKPEPEAKPATNAATGEFQELATERMRMMSAMSPDQRVAALQQDMLLMAQMDPANQQQMLLAQMNAQRNMDPVVRDAYRNAMRSAYHALRDQGLIPRNSGRGGGSRGRGRGN